MKIDERFAWRREYMGALTRHGFEFWVGDGCWRQTVLMTSLRCWWPIKCSEKITNITKKVANIMILSPTSSIGNYYKITNITLSSTSLSPPYSLYDIAVLITFWGSNKMHKMYRSLFLSEFQIIIYRSGPGFFEFFQSWSDSRTRIDPHAQFSLFGNSVWWILPINSIV